MIRNKLKRDKTGSNLLASVTQVEHLDLELLEVLLDLLDAVAVSLQVPALKIKLRAPLLREKTSTLNCTFWSFHLPKS